MAGDGQVLEIVLCEIRDFEGKALGAKLGCEELGLARGRAGSEAVQIEDTQRVGQHLMVRRSKKRTGLACEESAGRVEFWTETQARISHRFPSA